MHSAHRMHHCRRILLSEMTRLGVVLWYSATVCCAQSQSPANNSDARLAGFDVVSIKEAKSNDHMEWRTTEDSFSATLTPKALIANAYGLLTDDQVSGLPKWADSAVFHVEAKMDEATATKLRHLPEEQMREQRQSMLQSLLADRFDLTIHRETKELPIYALVIAKGGSRLKDSPANAEMSRTTGKGRLTAQAITMQSLAGSLSLQAGRIVVDRTGLTGKYDINLRWATDDASSEITEDKADSSRAEGFAPSLLTALQEQLGLKLESTRGPVEVIAVNRIDKPSAN